MKKQTLKYTFGLTFLASLAIILLLWFFPLSMVNESGNTAVVTNEKSFIRDIVPTLKANGKSSFVKNFDEIKNENVNSDLLVIDGNEEQDISDILKSFDGEIIVINPWDGFKIPNGIKGRIVLVGEAAGSLKADENAVRLYNQLTSSSIEPNGRQVHTEKGNVSLRITPAPVIMTGSLSSETLSQAGGFFEENGGSIYYNLPKIRLIISVVCLFSLLALCWVYAMQLSPAMEFPDGVVAATVKSNGLFFLSRLLLIVVSLLVALLVFVILGFFNSLHKGGILFLSYIIGCSFTTKIFYRFGMLGIKGKPIDIKIPFTTNGLFKSLFFTAIVLAGGLSLNLSGFWKLQYSSERLIMSAIVFVCLTFGFISVMQDLTLLQKAVKRQSIAAMLLMFPYIPLFLIAAVYVPLGEFYMTMSVLKLIGFTAICLLISKIIRDKTGSVMYSSMAGAFCLSIFTCCQMYI